MNQTNTSRPVFRFSIKQMLILVSACCLVSALSVQLEFTPVAGACALGIVAMLWLYRQCAATGNGWKIPEKQWRRRLSWSLAVYWLGVVYFAYYLLYLIPQSIGAELSKGEFYIFLLAVATLAVAPSVFVWRAFEDVVHILFTLSYRLFRGRAPRDEKTAACFDGLWTIPYAVGILVYIWLWYLCVDLQKWPGFRMLIWAVAAWVIGTALLAVSKAENRGKAIKVGGPRFSVSKSVSCTVMTEINDES